MNRPLRIKGVAAILLSVFACCAGAIGGGVPNLPKKDISRVRARKRDISRVRARKRDVSRVRARTCFLSYVAGWLAVRAETVGAQLVLYFRKLVVVWGCPQGQ